MIKRRDTAPGPRILLTIIRPSIWPRLFLFCLLSVSLTVSAKNPNLTTHQQAYLDAYQAIKQNDRVAIARYKAQLQNYELYPYLLYHDYRLHFKSTPKSRLLTFFKDNHNNYLGERLFGKWLKHLAETGQWKTYAHHYQPHKSRDLQCYFVQAKARLGQTDSIIKQAQTLWVTDSPLSKACRPLDKLLRQQRNLTGSMVWQRIHLAMQKRRTELAEKLARDLSKKERRMFEQWLAVYRTPSKIQHPLPAYIAPIVKKRMFIQGVKRLASRDPEMAEQSLQRFYKQYGLSQQQHQGLLRRIALRTAYRYDPQATDYLQEVNGNGGASEDSLRWQAQIALKNSNWRLLLETLELMGESQASKNQWQYWKARGLEETGEREAADAIYRTLAQKRNFYAFLSADKLNADYRFNPDPVNPVDSEKLIRKYPHLQRMQELLAIDWLISTKREWYDLLDKLEPTELHAVAILTSQWDQHSMAISTAAKAKKWNDLSIRFPMPHKKPVMQSADKHRVDPAWVYGVIRRESAFSHNIRSSAGAIGLMQLLPGTAKYIGKKAGIRKTGYRDLIQPNSNIELGSAYLSYLYQKYDGNRILATAAYNAGPRRVDGWIPKDRHLPADQWIDSIPFSETRGYVKAVMEYTTIFKSLLNKKYDRLETVMPPIGKS